MKVEEAKKALNEGYKITHRFFLDNEYVYLKNGEITTEKGYPYYDFWEMRSSKEWQDGWNIFTNTIN